jgi:hypothetical protein
LNPQTAEIEDEDDDEFVGREEQRKVSAFRKIVRPIPSKAFPRDGRGFSLSSRERAGVRGKGAF